VGTGIGHLPGITSPAPTGPPVNASTHHTDLRVARLLCHRGSSPRCGTSSGIPLGAVAAGANRHDAPLLGPTLATLDRLGPLPDQPTVHLDRGYDSHTTREVLAERGMTGQIAERAGPLRSRPAADGPWSGPMPGGNQFKKLV
jgi:IS5 family transposase